MHVCMRSHLSAACSSFRHIIKPAQPLCCNFPHDPLLPNTSVLEGGILFGDLLPTLLLNSKSSWRISKQRTWKYFLTSRLLCPRASRMHRWQKSSVVQHGLGKQCDAHLQHQSNPSNTIFPYALLKCKLTLGQHAHNTCTSQDLGYMHVAQTASPPKGHTARVPGDLCLQKSCCVLTVHPVTKFKQSTPV